MVEIFIYLNKKLSIVIEIPVDALGVILSLYSIISIKMEYLMKKIIHMKEKRIHVEKEVYLDLKNTLTIILYKMHMNW